jgi:hypothetical protein
MLVSPGLPPVEVASSEGTQKVGAMCSENSEDFGAATLIRCEMFVNKDRN